MDVSVVAAVGSFFMSERVLKPKATVLVVLGCILIYDLTTKTHDTASLRAYRGPALLAFTLTMVAFSLRTWRRNGVACDELLFLPGTPHGESQGSENETVTAEGDVAAGLGWSNENAHGPEMVELTNQEKEGCPRTRTLSQDSSLSSIREFQNSWDEENTPDGDEERVLLGSADDSTRPVDNTNANLIRQQASHVSRSSHANEPHRPNSVALFRESHPQITRIGSFFFFRSSSTSTQNAAYAPSGPSVVGAALDLSMPILFNFHLFIEAFNHYDVDGGSETPAKILPLIFLTILMVRTSIPPGRRGRFWGTLMYTFMAPFHPTRFRDCYLGDVLTSLVRPLQDIVYALAYYFTVIYGTITGKYGLSHSGDMLISSNILHHVIMPSCSMLPLWWRFLQSLRECYDSRRRWPYLGNSFKYLTAALVILYGITHPQERHTFGWTICFTLALLYQLWWDTVMDWELFIIAPREEEHLAEFAFITRISSVRPNSFILFNLQRYVIQPVCDLLWYVLTHLPNWKQIQLRPRRLYKDDAFYWRIFAYNCVFRAAWMLCFIPNYNLTRNGFNSDTHTYVGVLLPVIEILRRTFWGFLLLEKKTIHMTDNPGLYQQVDGSDEVEVSTSSDDNSKHGTRQFLPSWLGNQQQLHQDAAALSSRLSFKDALHFDDEMRHKLFLAELITWAVAFVSLGLWVTT